jgi:hypothetical protein
VIFIGALYFIRQTHLDREEILLKRCCKHGDKYTSILIRKFPDYFEGSHKPASEHLPDARSPAATPRAVWIDKGASNEKEIASQIRPSKSRELWLKGSNSAEFLH